MKAKMMARVRHERRVLGERKEKRDMVLGGNTYRLEKAVGTYGGSVDADLGSEHHMSKFLRMPDT